MQIQSNQNNTLGSKKASGLKILKQKLESKRLLKVTETVFSNYKTIFFPAIVSKQNFIALEAKVLNKIQLP